jgi:hypothetical protein
MVADSTAFVARLREASALTYVALAVGTCFTGNTIVMLLR